MTYYVMNLCKVDSKNNVTTTDDVVVLRSGAGLANCFKDVAEGTIMKITYNGKSKNPKTGRDFFKFSAQTGDVTHIMEQPVADTAVQDDTDIIEWNDE